MQEKQLMKASWRATAETAICRGTSAHNLLQAWADSGVLPGDTCPSDPLYRPCGESSTGTSACLMRSLKRNSISVTSRIHHLLSTDWCSGAGNKAWSPPLRTWTLQSAARSCWQPLWGVQCWWGVNRGSNHPLLLDTKWENPSEWKHSHW